MRSLALMAALLACAAWAAWMLQPAPRPPRPQIVAASPSPEPARAEVAEVVSEITPALALSPDPDAISDAERAEFLERLRAEKARNDEVDALREKVVTDEARRRVAIFVERFRSRFSGMGSPFESDAKAQAYMDATKAEVRKDLDGLAVLSGYGRRNGYSEEEITDAIGYAMTFGNGLAANATKEEVSRGLLEMSRSRLSGPAQVRRLK